MLKELFRDLEEAGVVPPGTAKEVSGISLRAGGVTDAAARHCGMEKQRLAGHGIWKRLSGPEAYDRNDKMEFERVSAVLQESLRQTSAQRR